MATKLKLASNEIEQHTNDQNQVSKGRDMMKERVNNQECVKLLAVDKKLHPSS